MYDTILYFIINAIIALAVALPMGTLHEYLHVRKAKQLGLKISRVSYLRNEVLIDVKDEKLDKQIRMAPYRVIFPLSLLILGLGLFFKQLGLMVGAGALLIMHLATYAMEGREVKEK